ncbi:PIN domain-containing protein [Corynebacterium cystitidis]|uniref:PIN domain-containing protein n=1 Tax=Corynebacterium cystitidis TaxID=35757 RepID=UPI00211ECD6B|nr:PIN domain-containing protein [Corynebacterium cystitidis]
MSGFRVVLDACVLFPIVQTDLLLSLAVERLFVPLWSERIAEEVIRNLEKKGILPRSRSITRFSAMNQAFPDALVTNWEDLEKGIQGLPDDDDRHVVAAAIAGNASAIVTENTAAFPATALAHHGLHTKNTDEFLLDVLDISQDTVITVIHQMSARRRKPPITPKQLVKSFQPFAPGFSTAVISAMDSAP